METGNVRSLLVLQNKHYLTSFTGDCRYYILIAIVINPYISCFMDNNIRASPLEMANRPQI